jgi:hypothetical protein
MKYAILNQRQRVIELHDEPPEQTHVEVTDLQAEEISDFMAQRRLAFLIDGQITNFIEQKSFGNSMRWNAGENKWDITPIE